MFLQLLSEHLIQLQQVSIHKGDIFGMGLSNSVSLEFTAIGQSLVELVEENQAI